MIFRTVSLITFTFQFMNLGIAAPNQSVAIPVKNPKKTNELPRRTDNEYEENGRLDVDMIKGDNGYYVELGVGNHQQNLRFQIDTESSAQLIVSNKCDSCFSDSENRRKFVGIDTESCPLDKLFNFKKFGISYYGCLSTEPIYLRKGVSEDVEFKALGTTSKMIDSAFEYDGIFGLGYPKTYAFHQNAKHGNSFIDTFLRNDKIVSINLKPGVEKISFGYQNKESTTQDTVWEYTIGSSTFQFNAKSIKIGLREFKSMNRIVVNPKYQKNYFPSNLVGIVKDFVANSGNCININALPAIIFTVEGGALTLGPKDYITFRNGVCESSIEEIDSEKYDPDTFIFGQDFFRKYVVAFDYRNNKIGFTN
ncbi:hypothetical protein BB558_007640 [Smittium angustum]|uniref:Peptidase A1 domain-containing protein n=1 Tax=Smittium angustum TaxID=133377 RepID=A0A2U1IUN8_SMIAN|nr:hypothetical protein BB558_007640 [Smittium angustum]